MLAISGPPYDTLEEVIGIRKEDEDLIEGGLTGSLDDYGVTYKQVELLKCVCLLPSVSQCERLRIREAIDLIKGELMGSLYLCGCPPLLLGSLGPVSLRKPNVCLFLPVILHMCGPNHKSCSKLTRSFKEFTFFSCAGVGALISMPLKRRSRPKQSKSAPPC